MEKSNVLRIIEQYSLAPNKKLGQNFLIDDNIINRIVNYIQAEGKNILEIGPGLGAISRDLAKRALSYTAVEIDSGFVRYLSSIFADKVSVSVIHGDFLKLDLEDKFDVIVSNLPYYCASEILFRIAERYTVPFVFCMMQKEMADRIMAHPGTENYGALTVNLAYYFNPEILFHVSGEVFYPRPDVRSSFLVFKRKEDSLKDIELRKLFHLIVKSAFWGRRKTILKSLMESPHINFSKEVISEALNLSNIEYNTRGEKLSLEEFLLLTKNINLCNRETIDGI